MKFSRWFFYLLLFLLPAQLGKHFWPNWTIISGLRVDYLSPTLYLTDLLILGIFVSWFFSEFSNKSLSFKKGGKVLFIFLFLLANCYFSQNQPAAFYKLSKLVELALLFLYVVKNKIQISDFRLPIFLAVLYSSFLAIFQFLNQGTLGGLFSLLGENTFNAGTPGIAQVVINGQLFLRPYASFPHPNVLAGFLTLGLLLTIFLKPKYWWFGLILGSMALFLTFSHTAWLGFLLGLLIFCLLQRKKTTLKLLILGFMVLLTIGLLGFRHVPIPEESITQRQELNVASLKMIRSSPFLGVGLGNFLVRLPEFYESHGRVRWLQPVHNLYLMIAAETGLTGLIIFIFFLFLTIKKLIKNISIHKLVFINLLFIIFFLGLFDHYFYSLQQGQILLALVFGLIWSGQERSAKISL